MFKIFGFATINNKRAIDAPDGSGGQILDLTESVFDIKVPLKFSSQPILVTDQFEGRPDLIAKSVYNSEDLTDLLLFFNGISNPLMVQRGMVIVVPDRDTMVANLKDNNKTDTNNISKELFNKKISKKDKDRIIQLINKNNADVKQPVEIRTPNMTKTGTLQVTPVDGRIVLGTNISDIRCKDKLSPVQTITEQIRAAVKSKIQSLSNTA